MLFANRHLIIDSVAALGLPAIYEWPEMAEEGGLVAYGPRLIDIFRDLQARQLAQLFRGVKPADIPIEQPTEFELVINLKTANALGIAMPATLVARADKVID
jgi:putative ABC transport system substrate-binding protein